MPQETQCSLHVPCQVRQARPKWHLLTDKALHMLLTWTKDYSVPNAFLWQDGSL